MSGVGVFCSFVFSLPTPSKCTGTFAFPRFIFGLAAARPSVAGRPGLPQETESSPPTKTAARAPFLGSGCLRGTARGDLRHKQKFKRPAPDKPPSPAAPGRLRPGEPEAHGRAEAAQAGPAADCPAPRGRGSSEVRPGASLLPPAAALPPTAARQPPSGPQRAAPSPPARAAGAAARSVTSDRPLGSSASRPLSTRLSLSMPPGPARAVLPHAPPDCPSPPHGLRAPACTAPPRATCARQVHEGRRGLLGDVVRREDLQQ